jgi:hypothetical protein
MILLASVGPEVFGYGGLAVGLGLLLLSLRAGRRRRYIDNTPPSKTSGVFIGMVELNGTAESESPLRSYLAELPCVQYRWSVEEHWSRTRTETYTDSNGKTQTRTVHESGWTTVAQGGEQSQFYLRDDCGTIRVNPDRAKIEDERVFSQEVRRDSPLYYAKGPSGAVMDSDHYRLFTEHAIPLHANLFLMGHARLRDDVVAPEIAYDKSEAMYIISTRTEKQISRGLAAQFWVLGILAILLAVGGWALAEFQGCHAQVRAGMSSHYRNVPSGMSSDGSDDSSRSSGNLEDSSTPPARASIVAPGRSFPDLARYILVATGALGVWILGWAGMAYNSMQSLRQRVQQSWANVDVQLKRRADLIPNLVSAVAGYRDYEQKLQTELALLRSQQAVTAPGQPGADPQGCLPTVMAIAEAYPDLKANQSFLKLQAALADTEQRIALAREYFNAIVAFYNTRLQVVPDKFICSLAGMKPGQFITAEDFQRAAVKVNLV